LSEISLSSHSLLNGLIQQYISLIKPKPAIY